jgi:hypothetical protein
MRQKRLSAVPADHAAIARASCATFSCFERRIPDLSHARGRWARSISWKAGAAELSVAGSGHFGRPQTAATVKGAPDVSLRATS